MINRTIVSTTPKKITKEVDELISQLGLKPENTVWLKHTKETAFQTKTGNCLLNVMVKQKLFGGDKVYGWVIWRDSKSHFVEAEFHCVWRDQKGVLCDITPRADGEKRVCFIPDPDRAAYLDINVNPPVAHTYSNVCIMKGKVLTGLTEILIIQEETPLLNYLKT